MKRAKLPLTLALLFGSLINVVQAQPIDVEQLKIDLQAVKLPFLDADGKKVDYAIDSNLVAYPSYGAFVVLESQGAKLITPNALIFEPASCQFSASSRHEVVYPSLYGGSLTLIQWQSATDYWRHSLRFSSKTVEEVCERLTKAYQKSMSSQAAEQLHQQLTQISNNLQQAQQFVLEHSSQEKQQAQIRLLTESSVKVLTLQRQLEMQFPQLEPVQFESAQKVCDN